VAQNSTIEKFLGSVVAVHHAGVLPGGRKRNAAGASRRGHKVYGGEEGQRDFRHLPSPHRDLSVALFLGGITAAFKRRKIKGIVLALSVITITSAAIFLAFLPLAKE
jgi:hypothetical protein